MLVTSLSQADPKLPLTRFPRTVVHIWKAVIRSSRLNDARAPMHKCGSNNTHAHPRLQSCLAENEGSLSLSWILSRRTIAS
jgi:hypothetical protein